MSKSSKRVQEFNVRLVLDERSGAVSLGFVHRLGDRRKDGSRNWLTSGKAWRRKLVRSVIEADNIIDLES